MPSDRTYPRAARLRLDRDFRGVLAHGRAVPGRECLVRVARREAGGARLGIASPRGMGGAVTRNRFRRLVREAFRALRAGFGPVDLLVSPRRGLTTPTLAGITEDLERAVRGRAAPSTPEPPRGRA